MLNPNPWKPDPSDNRVPIGPDDISMDSLGCIGQVLQNFPVKVNNDVGGTGTPAIVGVGCGFFRFLNETLGDIVGKTEQGALVHLMHRPGTGGIKTSLVIPDQPFEDTQDMVIGDTFKRVMGQLCRLFKKLVGFRFIHRAIVIGKASLGHSYFPSGIAMSSSSLFLPICGYTNVYEFFARGRK